MARTMEGERHLVSGVASPGGENPALNQRGDDMARFRIETVAQVKRTYFVTADSAADAEARMEDESEECSLEQEISEEIDEVAEVTAEEIAAQIAA